MSSLKTLSGFTSTGVHSDPAPLARGRSSLRPHLQNTGSPCHQAPTPNNLDPTQKPRSLRNRSLRGRNPAASGRHPWRQGGASPAPLPARGLPSPEGRADCGRQSVRPSAPGDGSSGVLSPQGPRAPTRRSASLASSHRAAARISPRPSSDWPPRSNPTALTSLFHEAAAC